jgi:hypothetical protein
MTYADNYNIRATSVKFNDVANAIDGLITRSYGGSTTGNSAAYIATPTPAWDAYYNSSFIIVIPHTTNLANATINVSGLGPKNITRNNSNIGAGTIAANVPLFLVFNGTTFEAGFIVVSALATDGSNSMAANLNFGGFLPSNVGAGTASLPAYCANNDTNTGMFSPAADTIGFATNGAERVRIDSVGDVGIGVTSPLYPIDVLAESVAAVATNMRGRSADNIAISLFTQNNGTTETGRIAAAPTYLRLEKAGSNPIQFYTNSTERMQIDGSGRVGIGTTSPTTILDVRTGSSEAKFRGNNPVVNLQNTSTTSGDGGVLRFDQDQTSAKPLAEIRARLVDGGVSTRAGDLAFFTSTQSTGTLTEKIRITQAGRLGIGTTAPDYLVHIAGSTGKTYIGDTIEALDAGANNNGAIYFGGAPSSTTLPTAAIEASWGSSNTNPQISIGVTRDGNKTRTIYDYSNTIRSFTANTERTRIDSNGYLLVGYTGSNGAYRLQVNSQIFATSSTIATSDANYKENVITITNGLDLVSALRPVQFDWKQHPVHDFSDSTTIGFIAQEVQEVLANTAYKDAIVKENQVTLPDGTVEPFLGIAEGNIIALLVSAIKELKARVEALENQL